MSSFDQLHPALQHHVVNSLGWRSLRPFQEEVIPEVLAGNHMIVLAPTAGGKTEAAIFPTLSRMLSEEWSGLSVLYICPIKALLNNLDVRLQYYCTLLGRRSALWHGDVKTSQRKKILAEAPDLLLTTPESLEVMLVSKNVDSERLFANLQMVIVDEVHAFAGDDRGWHLLSVLERVERSAGRELQRLGLSATVGNPEDLCDWLAGSCEGPRKVYYPQTSGGGEADVQLDYVGSLDNAAVVISRLHRGEKRLVFVDSRSKAEQLGRQLRTLDVTTFVSHSSLSEEQRKQAEEAFASRSNCVIVATSALELGIDVGDLDRVLQIDAPPTVASFLQRMGRTGRRGDTMRNCLFLATNDNTLNQAAALIDLWAEGFIEPIEPPALPYHILAQQLMALALQQGGIPRDTWFDWVRGVAGFKQMDPERVEELVAYMFDEEILAEDGGLMWLGPRGETIYGRKNFLELFSVFLAPPLFTVLQGRREIGYVDQLSFMGQQDGPRILLLGGRAWQVNHIDWQKRVAYVEATDQTGRTRWHGHGQGFSFEMSQAIKKVLAEDAMRQCWSQRAAAQIATIRDQFPWLDFGTTAVLHTTDSELTWWTYGGDRANATLANQLAQQTNSRVKHDSFALLFEPSVTVTELESALHQLQGAIKDDMHPRIDEEAVEGLKFLECLPMAFATHMLECRLKDPVAIQQLLQQDVRVVTEV